MGSTDLAAGTDPAAERAQPGVSVSPRARALAFAWSFALCALILRWLVHRVGSVFVPSASYDLGVLLSLGAQLLAGFVLGAPLLWARSRRALRVVRALCGVLAALAFALLAAAYHYHAMFARLPTTVSLGALQGGKLLVSLEAALPPWLLALEVAVPSAIVLALCEPLARALGRDRLQRGAWWLAAALLAAAVFAPRALQGQAYFGAVHPLQHLFAFREPQPERALPESQALRLARTVRAQLGVPERAPADPSFPYCSESSPEAEVPAAIGMPTRTVLMILLEGISNRELHASYQGKPLMPKLAELAREGLSFERFDAAGDRSSQALFSVLAGVPPETHRRVITHSRLVSFQGFPRALQQAGFDTWYFHGSDLSFEQQRVLLQRAGFARLSEPDPRSLADTPGWGLPDRELLSQLMRDVDARRQRGEDGALFALAATLTTHDPYTLPPGHARVFSGEDRYSRFAETARYLDQELARLYAWYVQHEKPRGTILALVSDHVPRVPAPEDPAETSTGEFEYRFDVPFMLFGRAIDLLDPDVKQYLSTRLGGHADVGPTVLQLAGVPPPPCALGMSLLWPTFPEQRWTVSIAGDNLEYLFVHAPPLRWMVPLDGRAPRLYDLDADPMLRRNLFQQGDPRWREVHGLVDAYMKLGAYLNLGDHFAPASRALPVRSRRAPRARQPLRVISHRGNALGAQGGEQVPAQENSFAAIDRALAAGFRWVEIDVQLTADEVPVLAHDANVRAPDGSELVLAKVSLAELRARKVPDVPTLAELFARYAGKASFAVELKPQRLWQNDMVLARRALQVIDARPAGMGIVVDSFSQGLIATIRRWSDVEVGWDLPQKPITRDWIELARDRELDWVYARHDLITPADVSALHAAGVRVMLYTLDDPTALARFGSDPPDGVITDSAAWLAPP